tara:strand:+ start:598 stop:1017 length:420 start_codon:yes stop_codon:yes gene_type:complete
MKRDSTVYAAVRPVYDKNDCAVRAVAVVAGCTYEQVSALFSAGGRQMKKGTTLEVAIRVNETFLRMRNLPEYRDWNIASFIAANPTGKFVIHRLGHALAIIDGTLHDWEKGTGANQRIRDCWQWTEETEKAAKRLRQLV